MGKTAAVAATATEAFVALGGAATTLDAVDDGLDEDALPQLLLLLILL